MNSSIVTEKVCTSYSPCLNSPVVSKRIDHGHIKRNHERPEPPKFSLGHENNEVIFGRNPGKLT